MKAIKILLKNHKHFIFSRNITTFLSAYKFNISKLEKSSCNMTALQRVRKEDRFMYGAITKRDRKIMEKLTNTSQNNTTIMNSELWWHLKNSRCMMKSYTRFKSPIVIVKVNDIRAVRKSRSNQSYKCNTKKAVVNIKENTTTNLAMSKDVKGIEIKYDKQDTESKQNDASETTDIKDKSKISSLKTIQLSDVVINNITLFPILNPKKKSPQTGKMDIMAISREDDPFAKHYPSVSKILAETLSPQSQRNLELYKAELIAKMGEEKFNEYREEQLENGRLFHTCIEDTLHGKHVDIPDHIQPAFNSLSSIVHELKDIKATESYVSHEHLKYQGKMDCVAVYRGKLCVIDWKKSEKDKSNLSLTYDAPVQIAAYIGALNYSENYPFQVDCGLVVVGYTNGKPANTYLINGSMLNTFWKKWLLKVQQYWNMVCRKK